MWKRIEELLTRKGLTIKDLAQATGIAVGTLGDLKAGRLKRIADPEKITRIAKALGTTSNYLQGKRKEIDESITMEDMRAPEENPTKEGWYMVLVPCSRGEDELHKEKKYLFKNGRWTDGNPSNTTKKIYGWDAANYLDEFDTHKPLNDEGIHRLEEAIVEASLAEYTRLLKIGQGKYKRGDARPYMVTHRNANNKAVMVTIKSLIEGEESQLRRNMVIGAVIDAESVIDHYRRKYEAGAWL